MPQGISRRAVLTGSGLLAAGGLGGCSYAVRYPYRYRLSLDVLVDGVLHSAANVVQVERHVRPPPKGNEGVGDILGVVVAGGPNVIDLGRGRPLVALLTRTTAINEPRPARHWDLVTPEPVLARIYGIEQDFEWDAVHGSPMLQAITEASGQHDIGLDDLPTLVTYARQGDPKSGLVEVDPFDLSATFGPGVSIGRATLEVTRRMMTLRRLQRINTSVPQTTVNATWGRAGAA